MGSYDDLARCEHQFLRLLAKAIEKVRPEIFVQNRTRSVRRILSEEIASLAIELGFDLSLSVELTDSSYPVRPHANLRIDFLLECKCDETGPHVFGFELCLDNQIALGTNVTKAIAMASKYPNSDTVFITLERNLLHSGGWDSTYTDSEIYEQDISHFYSKLIGGQLTLLSVVLNR
jgi:hypothetical protein